jgi:plastocyanin
MTATGSATVSGPAASATGITIQDFSYQTPVSVSPGAKVTVTNMDSAAHTVTADEGSAFDVQVQGSGGTGTFTAPSKAGSYPFHCTFHANMHGTLTVK